MCECTCGKSSEPASKFKVGDRVRIVSSAYTGHPARMAGSVGVVRRAYSVGGYDLEVDDGTFGTWFFVEGELEKIGGTQRQGVDDDPPRASQKEVLHWLEFEVPAMISRDNELTALDESIISKLTQLTEDFFYT